MKLCWHKTWKIRFANVNNLAGFFMYMDRDFFQPDIHASQPVLWALVKHAIMKTFEIGLCTIPPKKGSIARIPKSEVLIVFRQNISVRGLGPFTRICVVSKIFRLWAHPDISNFIIILTAVLLVSNISLNYVIL